MVFCDVVKFVDLRLEVGIFFVLQTGSLSVIVNVFEYATNKCDVGMCLYISPVAQERIRELFSGLSV